jgi:ThiF family
MSLWRIIIGGADWNLLWLHHFPGDGDEHGSVLLCGVVDDGDDRRLLVREVVLAREGIDYVSSERGYRRLTAEFVAETIDRCSREGLAYVAVHNHWGKGFVSFSGVDTASHERGYPALLDITGGGPVGALVLAEDAAAGDIWTFRDRSELEALVVTGPARKRLTPEPPPSLASDPACDRQVRLFGDRGQQILGTLRVGLLGLGGAGSLINQALAHLRVGTVVGVDDDIIDRTSLPRVVGATADDAETGTPKVDVAARLVDAIGSGTRFEGLRANAIDAAAGRALSRCDVLFLAADSMQARQVANAICQQYLIPGFQVGAKVPATDGMVGDPFAVARVLGPDGLCMWCAELISPTKLQEEGLSPDQRRFAQYVPGVIAPSVITMNALSTALAMNDFLFMVTGLLQASELTPRWYYFRTRTFGEETAHSGDPSCPECAGRKAKGDRVRLPVKL